MTFSIAAADPDTGELGVAVASKFLAVGSVVPWARAGAGAVATQAWANVTYGPAGLTQLAAGLDPAVVVDRLTGSDEGRAERQVGLVDAAGRAATFTGGDCMDWAGGRALAGAAIQGNILTGPEVVEAMTAAWSAAPVDTGRSLADRLLDVLVAGDRAGGDRRGRQSAALLVVRSAGGYGGGDDRWLDLRVDDHVDPVAELVRLRGLHHLYWDRPAASDLVVIDAALADELRERLGRLGHGPRPDPTGTSPRPAIGTPRIPPAGWTPAWQTALVAWMGVENLEERIAAIGWIDPAVVARLRQVSDPVIAS